MTKSQGVYKPDILTTFGRSDFTEHTILNNRYLTPDFGGQFIPANYDQGTCFSNYNLIILLTGNSLFYFLEMKV